MANTLPDVPGITQPPADASAQTQITQLFSFALAAAEQEGNAQSPGIGTKIRQELAGILGQKFGPQLLGELQGLGTSSQRAGALPEHLGDPASLLAIGQSVGEYLQNAAAEKGHGDLATAIAGLNGAAVGAQTGGGPGAIAGFVAGIMATPKGKQIGRGLASFISNLTGRSSGRPAATGGPTGPVFAPVAS